MLFGGGKKNNRDNRDEEMRGVEEEKRGFDRHNRDGRSPRDSSKQMDNF
jgi:hypothetical protein